MDRVRDVVDLVLGVGDLAGENASFARLGVMLLAIGRRKLVTAARTGGVAHGNQRLAFGALLGRRLAVSVRALLRNSDLIHRPVAQDVAPKIKDKAVLFARV